MGPREGRGNGAAARAHSAKRKLAEREGERSDVCGGRSGGLRTRTRRSAPPANPLPVLLRVRRGGRRELSVFAALALVCFVAFEDDDARSYFFLLLVRRAVG